MCLDDTRVRSIDGRLPQAWEPIFWWTSALLLLIKILVYSCHCFRILLALSTFPIVHTTTVKSHDAESVFSRRCSCLRPRAFDRQSAHSFGKPAWNGPWKNISHSRYLITECPFISAFDLSVSVAERGRRIAGHVMSKECGVRRQSFAFTSSRLSFSVIRT